MANVTLNREDALLLANEILDGVGDYRKQCREKFLEECEQNYASMGRLARWWRGRPTAELLETCSRSSYWWFDGRHLLNLGDTLGDAESMAHKIKGVYAFRAESVMLTFDELYWLTYAVKALRESK
jgi:hypothetical protein